MHGTFLGSAADDWFEVTTPQQARLLSKSRSLYHYAPFMGRELGTAEAARRAGVSTERMMYWVRQFLAAGLLQEVEKQGGSGRAVRLYQAPRALKIPFHLTPFDDLSAQLSELGQFYEELRVRATARLRSKSGHLCRLLYLDDEKGTLNIETETDGQEREIETNFAGTLWLPPDAARELEAQCEALYRMFETYSLPQPGTAPYLFSAALVTLDPQEDARWLRDFTLPEDQTAAED